MAAPKAGISGRQPIVVTPNDQNTQVYSKLYERYRRLAETVRVAFP